MQDLDQEIKQDQKQNQYMKTGCNFDVINRLKTGSKTDQQIKSWMQI